MFVKIALGKWCCHEGHGANGAGATIQANSAMGDSLMIAGIVGVPIFFLLLITIGPAQQQFSGVYGMLDQVAAYQFIGAAPPCSSHGIICHMVEIATWSYFLERFRQNFRIEL